MSGRVIGWFFGKGCVGTGDGEVAGAKRGETNSPRVAVFERGDLVEDGNANFKGLVAEMRNGPCEVVNKTVVVGIIIGEVSEEAVFFYPTDTDRFSWRFKRECCIGKDVSIMFF